MPDAILDGRGSGNTWGIDENNAGFVTSVGSGGTTANDPLISYKASEQDLQVSTVKYFGFVNQNGAWYILQQSGASNSLQSFRYAQGGSELSTNWGNRTSLSYDTFDNVF